MAIEKINSNLAQEIVFSRRTNKATSLGGPILNLHKLKKVLLAIYVTFRLVILNPLLFVSCAILCLKPIKGNRTSKPLSVLE